MGKPEVYTVGHSNYSIEEFIETLQRNGVDLVVDVRSVPRSRIAPQFDRETLEQGLARAGIRYRYMGAQLGGRGAAVAAEREKALGFLATEATRRTIVIVCAEEDPTKCHRLRLADELSSRYGVRVFHIRRGGRRSEHRVQLGLILPGQEQ